MPQLLGPLSPALINIQREHENGRLCLKEKKPAYFSALTNIKEGSEILELSQGDSGALWVKDIFDEHLDSSNMEKYEPGYFRDEASLGSKDVTLEVLVRYGD